MTHLETGAKGACVPVYDTDAQASKTRLTVGLEDTTGGAYEGSHFHNGPGPAAAGLPDQPRVHPIPDTGGAVRSAPEKRSTGEPGSDNGFRVASYTSPVTRSPLDPWHSEEYLVACLVKMHGWRWDAPRVLRGPWRRPRVRSFMHPEGE